MELSKTKKGLSLLPEIVFIVLTLIGLTGSVSGFIRGYHHTGNIITIAVLTLVLAVLAGQFFWKKFWIAVSLSILFGFAAIYCLLATWSEASEFLIRNTAYWELVVVGNLLALLLMVCAIIMPIKYAKH
jgi:hypothetical protein